MKPIAALTLTTLILAAARGIACDICGASLLTDPAAIHRGFYLGATEQFTRYGSVQDGGREIDNDARQFLDSSITQIIAGYDFTDRFGLQVNVPLIDREFRRTVGTGTENSNVSGIGDISVLANWTPIRHSTDDFTFSTRLTGGVKLPTGNSDRIGEEASESEDEGGIPSAVHGHDLALGSGSVDVIFGASIYTRYKRAFLATNALYALRTEGDFDYRYASDFSWSGGIGAILIDDEKLTFAISCVCSGETKGEDRFRGARADDTAVTTVFLGPKFAGSWKNHFTAEVELDAPIHRDNSGIQAVPDYRVRASIGWRF